MIWVESCDSAAGNCDPDICDRCNVVNQKCAWKTYTFNEGATCKDGYFPITSSWDDCRDAGIALGVSDRAIKDVETDFPWGSSKPKGCFRDGRTNKIHFNRGEGGGASTMDTFTLTLDGGAWSGDKILCRNFDDGGSQPKPTPQPTPQP